VTARREIGSGLAETVDGALTTRRSIRAFLSDPVPRETVRHILEVASRAPSGTNIQPWHVWVVAGEAKAKLSQAVLAARDAGEEYFDYAYYPKQWTEPFLSRRRKVGYDLYGLVGIEKGDKEAMWRQHTRNFVFFDAPVGLFFTFERILETGTWLDVGMFIEAVMVAARGQGLDTCPQVAWIGYHKAIREELGIPEEHTLVCGMSMGYADLSKPENKLVTEREPVEAFTEFFGFEGDAE